MTLADEVDVVPLQLTEEVMRKLLEFDRDSQALNFPKDAPDPATTDARIRGEYAEEPEGMRLVVQGRDIVGCLFMKTKYNPYRRCRFLDLRNIYLLPSHRSKGIGPRLLEVMEAYAREKGCRYLCLGTSAANEAARRLFSSFGFTVSRVIMEKELP